MYVCIPVVYRIGMMYNKASCSRLITAVSMEGKGKKKGEGGKYTVKSRVKKFDTTDANPMREIEN